MRAPRRAVAFVIAVAVVALAGSAAAQQAAAPPTSLEPVVVTVTRMEQRAEDAPAAVTVITSDDIRHSVSQTVDDLLRQVPGFSLFRRSSSMVGHPTTQGLSLRGIGPSGTSRALVLVDGVPVNDPFGGWVYWNRIPMLGVDQIEVVRGGGSSAWGNYALGGIVHVLTRRPTERSAAFEASYGSHDTLNLDALLTDVEGPFRIALEVNRFETGGYPIVLRSRRGAIDIDADSEHTTFNGRAELVASPDLTLFVRGDVYDEDRGNGTHLQFNRTDAGSVATGGRLRTADGSEWRATLFAQLQDFRSTFTTQALDRNSETLALDQKVPSTSVGGWLQWSRAFATHLLAAGGDGRWVEGETNEKVLNAGVFARTRVAGAQQVVAGVFAQDVWTPVRAVEIVGGVRADYWTTYDASRRDTPPPAGVPARQQFDDRDGVIPSARLAALMHAAPGTDVRASVYQGFRVPTVNELFRVFRVRNDVTVANAELEPERLVGGEVGVQQRFGPFEARVTAFWNEVQDLVANVTVPRALPDCPAGTTCRQRQNLDLARIRGFETEVEYRVSRDWRLLAGYLFTDARVAEASQQPALEGKRLAQVPEHHVTASVSYRNPAIVDATLSARYIGGQYEDDLNTLPLGGYVVFDVFVSRAVTRWGQMFLGVENLTDETYAVGRTTEGVVSIGAPRLVRGGVRLTF